MFCRSFSQRTSVSWNVTVDPASPLDDDGSDARLLSEETPDELPDTEDVDNPELPELPLDWLEAEESPLDDGTELEELPVPETLDDSEESRLELVELPDRAPDDDEELGLLDD